MVIMTVDITVRPMDPTPPNSPVERRLRLRPVRLHAKEQQVVVVVTVEVAS